MSLEISGNKQFLRAFASNTDADAEAIQGPYGNTLLESTFSPFDGTNLTVTDTLLGESEGTPH